jgi:hypothetical protein
MHPFLASRKLKDQRTKRVNVLWNSKPATFKQAKGQIRSSVFCVWIS